MRPHGTGKAGAEQRETKPSRNNRVCPLLLDVLRSSLTSFSIAGDRPVARSAAEEHLPRETGGVPSKIREELSGIEHHGFFDGEQLPFGTHASGGCEPAQLTPGAEYTMTRHDNRERIAAQGLSDCSRCAG